MFAHPAIHAMTRPISAASVLQAPSITLLVVASGARPSLIAMTSIGLTTAMVAAVAGARRLRAIAAHVAGPTDAVARLQVEHTVLRALRQVGGQAGVGHRTIRARPGGLTQAAALDAHAVARTLGVQTIGCAGGGRGWYRKNGKNNICIGMNALE